MDLKKMLVSYCKRENITGTYLLLYYQGSKLLCMCTVYVFTVLHCALAWLVSLVCNSAMMLLVVKFYHEVTLITMDPRVGKKFFCF